MDSPANGPAPLPWNIPVAPPEKFKDLTVYVEVPHTASVKVCFNLLPLMLLTINDDNGLLVHHHIEQAD